MSSPPKKNYANNKENNDDDYEFIESLLNLPTTSNNNTNKPKFKKKRKKKYNKYHKNVQQKNNNNQIETFQQNLNNSEDEKEIELPPINLSIKKHIKNTQNNNNNIISSSFKSQSSEEIVAKQIANSTNSILFRQIIQQEPSKILFFKNNQERPRPLNSQNFLPPPITMHSGNINNNNSGRPPMKRPHLMHQQQPRHHLQQRGIGQVQHRMPHHQKNIVNTAAISASIPQQHQQVQQQETTLFPQCANDVLVHVGDFVKQHGQFPNKSWNRVKIKELQNLLDQNLFCLATDLKSSRLNPLQHFKLLGIVCNYFDKEVSKVIDPKLRYLHFDIIFCGREGEPLLHEARVHFLIKICSLAAQFPVYGLFDNVAQWLGKVTSDELKRTYADQIVSELVEGFIFGPEKYKLHEHLLPLVEHSFEFCANFIVFSINKETLSPVMALIIGEWLCPRINQFLRYLSLCTHLSLPFCGQKFDLLLRYDCSSLKNDDIHYKLHYVLVKIINEWKHGFTPTQNPKRPPNTSGNAQTFQHPIVSCLNELFQSIETLTLIAQSRILELVINSARSNFFYSMEPFRNKIVSLETKELSESHGTMWHSLEVLSRLRKGEV